MIYDYSNNRFLQKVRLISRQAFFCNRTYPELIYYILLHPINYYVLYTTTSYTLLHPIHYYILYNTTSYTLLHLIHYYILYTTTSYTLLHPLQYCILYTTTSYTLLHPIHYNIILFYLDPTSLSACLRHSSHPSSGALHNYDILIP